LSFTKSYTAQQPFICGKHKQFHCVLYFNYFNAYHDIAMPPKSIAVSSEGGATNSPAESGNGIQQREDNTHDPAALNHEQTPPELATSALHASSETPTKLVKSANRR
jgi:hypothetical protein